MDWQLAREAELAALERIVALLFALADLAERAGSRSRPVRGLVLWLLFPAETVARNLLIGSTVPPPLRPASYTPADAMRLAASLRSLAGAFRDLSRWTLRCANPGSPGGRIGFPIPDLRIGALAWTLAETTSTAFQPWTPYDTS